MKKGQPEIRRNSERLDDLDAHQAKLIKNLHYTSNQVQENVKEIPSLKQMTGNQNNNLDGLHKTVAIFEGRHVETVEKIKKVTVLASDIQAQVKEQEQKIVEQSSNNLNQIRDQIQCTENQN